MLSPLHRPTTANTIDATASTTTGETRSASTLLQLPPRGPSTQWLYKQLDEIVCASNEASPSWHYQVAEHSASRHSGIRCGVSPGQATHGLAVRDRNSLTASSAASTRVHTQERCTHWQLAGDTSGRANPARVSALSLVRQMNRSNKRALSADTNDEAPAKAAKTTAELLARTGRVRIAKSLRDEFSTPPRESVVDPDEQQRFFVPIDDESSGPNPVTASEPACFGVEELMMQNVRTLSELDPVTAIEPIPSGRVEDLIMQNSRTLWELDSWLASETD